jgi:hypothetical protein
MPNTLAFLLFSLACTVLGLSIIVPLALLRSDAVLARVSGWDQTFRPPLLFDEGESEGRGGVEELGAEGEPPRLSRVSIDLRSRSRILGSPAVPLKPSSDSTDRRSRTRKDWARSMVPGEVGDAGEAAATGEELPRE